ncbi:MAG: hypothetical protein ACO1OB_14820 [Archangium sp.]
MERKSNSTTVVTKETVATGLKTVTTTAREEQALRMRYGATVDMKAPLPRAHGNDGELADELLLIEMHLLRAVKARNGANTTVATRAGVKSKIAAKLGKK